MFKIPGLPSEPVHFDHLRSAVLLRTVTYSLISGPSHVSPPVKTPYAMLVSIRVVFGNRRAHSVAGILAPEHLREGVQLTRSLQHNVAFICYFLQGHLPALATS